MKLPSLATGRARLTAAALVLAASATVILVQPTLSPSAAGSDRFDVLPVRPAEAPPRDAGGADGRVPDTTTVLDDVPAVTNLDADLRQALRDAARDAARAGVTLHVTSGWRSRSYQAQLLREAISTYGSAAEAARWVATPDTSPHVSGDAVDLGPVDAMDWVSRHGAAYGLCQIYANEPWHYELRAEAPRQGCPPPYADPTQDPRMVP